MASSKALWVLGLARLISSASSTWANNGAGVEHKGFFAALVHRHAGQVTGHQVGGELHPRELQAEGARQRVGQGGFAHAGYVVDQQVTTGQQAGRRSRWIWSGLPTITVLS